MMDANPEINFSEIEKTLKIIADLLKEELVAELVKQGHKATGELINSIEMKIEKDVDMIALDGMFIFYGRNVDQGRRAGARMVPIAALIEWVKQKGFSSDAKKQKGIAFAIQRTIFKKGISTPYSWKGETTKNWMTGVIDRNNQVIADLLSEHVSSMLSIAIGNIITSATTFYTAK